MTDTRVKDTVIAGGGTAGWMPTAFTRVLGKQCSIRLTESAAIGTPFRSGCRTMPIPPEPAGFIRRCRDSGRSYRDAEEVFFTRAGSR